MAGPNPDPAHVTDAVWQLWTGAQEVIPGVRLGGIYANKVCYHNTVKANQQNWPGAYCIRVPLDLQGPKDKARAFDFTMSTAEMIKRTGYLVAAVKHPHDNRLDALREFIGTIDGKHVICYIHDSETGEWRLDTTRDASHLWHIHGSIFTAFVALWARLKPVLSVLAGVSWEQWLARPTEGTMKLFKFGDDYCISRLDGSLGHETVSGQPDPGGRYTRYVQAYGDGVVGGRDNNGWPLDLKAQGWSLDSINETFGKRVPYGSTAGPRPATGGGGGLTVDDVDDRIAASTISPPR